MSSEESRFEGIKAYLEPLSGDARSRIASLCGLIETTVPEATGRITYQMPAYFLDGKNLVCFAAFKKHIGFYPVTDSVFREFEFDLASFPQSGRGTVQFPYRVPFPLELLQRIVLFRVEECRKASRE